MVCGVQPDQPASLELGNDGINAINAGSRHQAKIKP